MLLPLRNPKNEPRITELNWYFRYGKYKERISKDRKTEGTYVVGDFAWNKLHPDKQEYIEPYIKY